MILYDKLSSSDKAKLVAFKEKYYQRYVSYLQEELDNKLLNGFTNNNDTINQIYCCLQIVPDRFNYYLEFIKIIQKYFALENKKVLEVGAGSLPILASYLEFKALSYDIMDPGTILEDVVGIKGKVIKEKFSLATNITDYDLLIGYNPCAATESMIRNCLKNHKEFIIALCGCAFLPENYKVRTNKQWQKYLLQIIEKSGQDYNLYIEYFKDYLNIEYPILVMKLKK